MSSSSELLERATGGPVGDRRSLARLLSLVERGGPPAHELSRLTAAVRSRSYSVGLTGAPGAGKSTLTGQLVSQVLKRAPVDADPKETGVAVLAIDPSSPLSGGAILGDRVRMQEHALDRRVFIRSMATRGHLGGLAAAVPEAFRLLDAAGWPLVLIETVGVGQVEVEVAGTCDTVVVVLNPGWGDAVQANKAGLLEVADVLVINKADRPGVRETKRDLVHMLQLTGEMSWTPPIVETVASSGDGVGELLDAISSHRAHLEADGRLTERRRSRMADQIERMTVDHYAQQVHSFLTSEAGSDLLGRIAARELDPSSAVGDIVKRISAS